MSVHLLAPDGKPWLGAFTPTPLEERLRDWLTEGAA